MRWSLVEWDWFHGGKHDDLFWWTDGNFGCDCNRSDSFYRAAGEENPVQSDNCNDYESFTVSYALLPGGERIAIDDPRCDDCGCALDPESDAAKAKWCDDCVAKCVEGR